MIANKIEKGDIIGIISPSNAIYENCLEDINKSILLMEGSGYKVKFAKNAFSNSTGYGGTAKEKADDINDMFNDKDVKMIWCAKGGGNSNSVFSYLDYNAIKNNPKIICGYSDSTSILNMITEKTGLVTFSGTTFKSLTTWQTDYGYRQIIKKFQDASKKIGEDDDRYNIIKAGIADGILVGGNLSLVSELVCGKYCLDFQDKILFIEELGLESEPLAVSNHIYYMKQNGVFDKIHGLWIGNYEHDSKLSLEKIVLDTIGDEHKFPIIKSDNFGHTDKKAVIPIGTKVRLSSRIEQLESCVR